MQTLTVILLTLGTITTAATGGGRPGVRITGRPLPAGSRPL